MPRMKMAKQNGNSCAAHCTVIAIAELFDTPRNMTPQYAENTVWPAIKFLPGENPLTDGLAALDNSDPRKVAAFANMTGGGEAVTADLLCDEVSKVTALTYVDAANGAGLGALFNMIKGARSTVATTIRSRVYFNCSFLMFDAGIPSPADYSGMHNILVTRVNGTIWYYNSNEDVPAWRSIVPGADWKVLTGQNGNAHSYVYTGVAVTIESKV